MHLFRGEKCAQQDRRAIHERPGSLNLQYDTFDTVGIEFMPETDERTVFALA